MLLRDADALAQRIVDSMRPYSERIEIAGSIRRRKVDPKDIEIVVIPRWSERPATTTAAASARCWFQKRIAASITFCLWLKVANTPTRIPASRTCGAT